MAGRLPPDLLAHIFIEGSKIDHKQRQEPEFREQNYPEFRDVITIWAFIDLSDYLLKRVGRYIARSGPSQPLDIYLNVTRRFLRGLSRWDGVAQSDRVESVLS
ncbi:hypothetical protein FRC06_001429, partial [Ceratobasidium sp. 370]